MNKFEKVSYEQFKNDIKAEFHYNDELAQTAYDAITLPRRATKGSAGYDVVSPITFVLNPNDEIKVPIGIKCSIDEGWFLMVAPRSGQGFKYYARLANTLGIIDLDFYNNEGNEGHCWVKLRNEGNQSMRVQAGESFAQAIFVPFGITVDDDPVKNDRVGGLGSTSK